MQGFPQHRFVYLSAIDILTSNPVAACAYLKGIRPSRLGQIPTHALDRNLDLFFLNTAEHFTLTLTPDVNEYLLVAATQPYLAASSDRRLTEVFEAAHSVMLAVFSAPQNVELTVRHLPDYIAALFVVCLVFSLRGKCNEEILMTINRSFPRTSPLINFVLPSRRLSAWPRPLRPSPPCIHFLPSHWLRCSTIA